jgi:formate dehydrogenase major subunit
MTRRAVALDAIEGEPHVDMHPEDMHTLEVADEDWVTITSRRGSITLKARESRSPGRGAVFVPFCWREAAANVLTIDELDPFGKIPEFKFCAVRVERASLADLGRGAAE